MADEPTPSPEEYEPLKVYSWADIRDNLPKRPPVLIGTEQDGILRRGHVMEITAASKAGKTWLAIELAAAIATGTPWLGLPCTKSRVLYLNFEIDGASFDERIGKVWDKLGKPEGAELLEVVSMRGNELLSAGLDKLADKVAEATGARAALAGIEPREYYSAIIFDPFYMAFSGDENNAGDVKAALRTFIALAEATGAAVVYIHHHAKGASGGKDSIDRGAGSGVHGRAPDTVLDLSELALPERGAETLHTRYTPEASAWQVSFSLREFHHKKPVYIVYDFPMHVLAPADLNLSAYAVKGKYASEERKQEKTAKEWKERNMLITNVVEKHPEGIEAKQAYEELGGTAIGDVTYETFKRWLKDNRCDFKVIESHTPDGIKWWPIVPRD